AWARARTRLRAKLRTSSITCSFYSRAAGLRSRMCWGCSRVASVSPVSKRRPTALSVDAVEWGHEPSARFLVMSYPANLQFSPYRVFTRDEWARLRADTPMTLQESELEQLSGLIEELSVEEVEQIYLPMSRLLNLYVAAAQQLHSVSSKFLGRTDGKV